jgi:hypothetical protein
MSSLYIYYILLQHIPDIHSSIFIHQWLYSPLLGPDLFFSFVIFITQTVGRPGRVISLSLGRYLHTGQHKQRIYAHRDIHALSEIPTRNTNVREREDNSCHRSSGHRGTSDIHTPMGNSSTHTQGISSVRLSTQGMTDPGS